MAQSTSVPAEPGRTTSARAAMTSTVHGSAARASAANGSAANGPATSGAPLSTHYDCPYASAPRSRTHARTAILSGLILLGVGCVVGLGVAAVYVVRQVSQLEVGSALSELASTLANPNGVESSVSADPPARQQSPDTLLRELSEIEERARSGDGVLSEPLRKVEQRFVRDVARLRDQDQFNATETAFRIARMVVAADSTDPVSAEAAWQLAKASLQARCPLLFPSECLQPHCQCVRELHEAKDADAERKIVETMALKTRELEAAMQQIASQTTPMKEVHEVVFFGSQLAMLAEIASKRPGCMQMANDLMSQRDECLVLCENVEHAYKRRIGMMWSERKDWQPGARWAVCVEAYFWPSDEIDKKLKALFAEKSWAYHKFGVTGTGTPIVRATRDFNGEKMDYGFQIPPYSPSMHFTVRSPDGLDPILKKLQAHRIRKVDHGTHRITVVIDDMADW